MSTRDEGDIQVADLPEQPIQRLVAPLARFLHVEAAGGVVLLVATLVALLLANSPWGEGFLAFWKTRFEIGFEPDFELTYSLKHWVSDGLMAIFFFVVGLEVKREFVLGELRDLRKAALPIAAAVGGMLAPAAIYLALQWGEEGARGWGIPMATDIAFAVGCLIVLGERVPRSLRILLLSLAIADDIGAILVIAIGYTSDLDVVSLVIGFVGIGVVSLCSRLGVRSVGVYTVLGIWIWLEFHASGVHATIAGVILGLMTPAKSWVSQSVVGQAVDRAGGFLTGEGWHTSGSPRVLRQVERVVREAVSPLERLETALHPWSSFVILPLFALANAGVVFQLRDLLDPVAVAVVAGLVLGKPIGVVLASFVAVRLRLASLPEGVGWTALAGVGCLAGIGFTMALFIAGLALEGQLLKDAKVGILAASVISAVLGVAILRAALPTPSRATES